VDSRFALKVTDYGVNKFTLNDNELSITDTAKGLSTRITLKWDEKINVVVFISAGDVETSRR